MSFDEDIDSGNPEQGSEQWAMDRAGCITASRMRDLIWTPEVYKIGEKKGQPKPVPEHRAGYIRQIAAEIITGRPKESASARALDHGKENEPIAVAHYESRIKMLVEQCGFVRHPEHSFIGASPDFLVDDDGGGEVKCPLSIEVHLRTLVEGLPEEHVDQIQGGLWVTGRLWWDFVSYHAAFPPGLDLYVHRVHRDSARIMILREHCLSAWDEVQAIVATLQQRSQG